jgi:hypothetical protein
MLLQSLLRPVLTPIMRGIFDPAQSVSAAWSPMSLWPDGIATPGMWISPRDLTSEWADYTGTTPVVTPGTVADSSNPVGLALDVKSQDATNYATHPGVDGSYFSTPNSVTLQVTGDLDLRWHGKLRLWNTGTSQVLIAKRDGAGNNFGYELRIVSGALWFNAGITSTTQGDVNSTAVVPFTANSAGWVRATRTSSTGDIRFYTSTDGTTWTQLGETVARVAGASYASTAALNIGAASFAGNAPILGGYTYQAQVLDGIDGTVVSNFTAAPYVSGATLVATTGETWTINGSCYIKPLGLHMLQSTSVDRPLLAAYDGQTLGPGDTYDATGFPIFQKYDGVDDGMATAAFTAGTFIDGMDCLITVRRDSAAACIAGLYNGIADATKFFGMAESGSGSGCVGSGAGTPTVWVDNAQLTGGTAVTRGTLHTALTVGDYHILEFRGLDLSTWTAAGFGLYTSYVFPGARGDILLYPSTASTTDKDAARQYLADYYGVTLP